MPRCGVRWRGDGAGVDGNYVGVGVGVDGDGGVDVGLRFHGQHQVDVAIGQHRVHVDVGCVRTPGRGNRMEREG